MALAFTYVLSTSIGKIRFLIRDMNFATMGTDLTEDRSGWTVMFEDSEIQAAIDMESDLYLAAAALLRSAAIDPQRLAIAVRVGAWGGDAGIGSRTMLDAAAILEKKAQSTPAAEVSEVIYDDFSYRTALQNEALRESE